MLDDAVTQILRRDPRYARAAYDFVGSALRRAIERADEPGHVNARTLLESIRDMARDDFGPLAKTVLHDWGVHSTDDFGQIVFNLIDAEAFGKTDDDRISDFGAVYAFDEAFPDETGPVQVFARAGDEDDLLDDEDDDAEGAGAHDG